MQSRLSCDSLCISGWPQTLTEFQGTVLGLKVSLLKKLLNVVAHFRTLFSSKVSTVLYIFAYCLNYSTLSCLLLIKFLLWQFHMSIWCILITLTPLLFPFHPVNLPSSLQIPFSYSHLLFSHPLSVTRAISVNMGLGLSPGDQWVPQWVCNRRYWPPTISIHSQ